MAAGRCQHWGRPVTALALLERPSVEQPAVAIADHPLADPVLQLVPVGATIASTCPDLSEPWVCRLDGQWILRRDWDRPLELGQSVEWVRLVAGGGNSPLRTILQVAVLVAAAYIGGPAGVQMFGSQFAASAAAVAVSMLGTALINQIAPLETQANGGGPSASPTYNASLAGNQARLDQPIPDAYGYNRHWPDFAAQPYIEYDDAGDQYYHALLCIGYGSYSIKRLLLDDTPLRNFAGVTWQVLGPGVAPTIVNPRVSTATEVAGQEMLTAQPIGPIAACRPRTLATHIGIDVTLQALGVANSDGSMGARTVTFRVEVQSVDAFGQPLGPWRIVGTESITAATVSPVRRSFKYALITPIRPLVRLTRLDEASDDNRVYDDVQWAGLRAYLSVPAPLCAQATYLEIRIKANEQLSGLSQRRIAVTAHRLVRTWTPGGGWGPLVETRNPAWALLNKLRDPVTGDRLGDAGIDLATFHALAQTWEARQDHFDYVFDTRQDSRRADQVIARAGRAVVFDRGGVVTISRDQWDPLPARVFSGRQLREGSWRLTYPELPRSDSPQGVRVEYLDYRSWDWESIDCPMPGHTVTPDTRWQVERLAGVIGPAQAEREGRHMAAALLYRREMAEWTAEAEGAMLEFNASVRFAPPHRRWAGSGDCVDWDPATRTLTLSEPAAVGLAWSILLVGSTGTASPAIGVTQGANPYQVILASDPPFTPVVDDARRERTRWLIGATDTLAQVVRVRSVVPGMREFGKAPAITVSGVVDAIEVHEADVNLLPAPGVAQDPIDAGDDASGAGSTPEGGAGEIALVQMFDLTQGNSLTAARRVGVRLASDGRLYLGAGPEGGPIAWAAQPTQWLRRGVAPGVGAGFRARAAVEPVARWVTTDTGDGSSSSLVFEPATLTGDSSAIGTLLPLDTDRIWMADGQLLRLRVVVTDAVSDAAQGSALYSVDGTAFDSSSGGGTGGA